MAERKSVTIEDPDVASFVENVATKQVDELALGRQKCLREELQRMKEKDDNAKARKRYARIQAVKEAKEKMYKEKIERGITIIPEAAHSRQYMKDLLGDEYRLALSDKQKTLRKEKRDLQSAIDDKLGISALPKGEKLMSLTADFYSNSNMPNQHLPDHITKTLTTQEIDDLRNVFDLFDVRNKGYITADDLRQVAGIMGYKAKKRVFKEMIAEITSKNKRGRVTFVSFLDLVIKLQADGPDHYEEMERGFRLLDHGEKGFVTFNDLRQAADALDVPLSNKAIREMLEEADMTGDGKITSAEFIKVISQAETFTTPS